MRVAVKFCVTGGQGGIRTPGTVTRTPHFECGAFNRSATCPFVNFTYLRALALSTTKTCARFDANALNDSDGCFCAVTEKRQDRLRKVTIVNRSRKKTTASAAFFTACAGRDCANVVVPFLNIVSRAWRLRPSESKSAPVTTIP